MNFKTRVVREHGLWHIERLMAGKWSRSAFCYLTRREARDEQKWWAQA
jgi:hypothetical protein